MVYTNGVGPFGWPTVGAGCPTGPCCTVVGVMVVTVVGVVVGVVVVDVVVVAVFVLAGGWERVAELVNVCLLIWSRNRM